MRDTLFTNGDAVMPKETRCLLDTDPRDAWKAQPGLCQHRKSKTPGRRLSRPSMAVH